MAFLCLFSGNVSLAIAQQHSSLSAPSSTSSVFLQSAPGHAGAYNWQMKKAGDTNDEGASISSADYNTADWLPAIVPGTVLNSLVADKVYPEPYYGDNNRKSRKLIPDIADTGREFYHYWFRTSFTIPTHFTGRHVWIKFHGINYRCVIWLNGKKIGDMAGMFNDRNFDITGIINRKDANALAVDMLPVDMPGSYDKRNPNRPGAVGENHNGGDGEIGKNVTMLMSVGWDFTAPDGIRDRNTGIWREVELYATGDVTMQHPFVQTSLPLPDTSSSKETVSVELVNASGQPQEGILKGSIVEAGVYFQKNISLAPNEKRTIVFTPDEYKQLHISHPRLWWPVNKGRQNLYTLSLQFSDKQNQPSHALTTRFGIREISSDQQTPDQSRRFLVNGAPVFIRGTNWIPEAMLRQSRERTYAELRYTRQAGVNLLRLWGGGIAESDYFYQLCDEWGLLVWNEFWLTGDTRFPSDTALYLDNLSATVKRIRQHPSVAYYVAANESGEVPGTAALVHALDPAIGYQVQSECCGVHDGSPYKYENPMQYFENTASRRGSRVDGFNPEYGTPCLPVIESLRELMPAKNLWPINDSVWNYLDGNGFHQITTKYRQAVDAFGPSSSIEEYARKAQFAGALNYRAIWEVWNYNKFNYGDRFASGFLFWYHNSPLPQTASRMYDWFLEPTAALYYSKNALEPLHPQFDYLKNTVSVYNDYRTAFKNYTVEATVYDFNTRRVYSKRARVNIPADAVVKDALQLDFPDSLTQIHFIKLRLLNAAGKLVADAFYWRSKDAYKGAWTMTGPAVSGFADINKLAPATLSLHTVMKPGKDKLSLQATVINTSGRLAFFTRLKLLDENGKSIRPAFYSDNFFSLLPGQSKQVTIDVMTSAYKGKKPVLVAEPWNGAPAQVVAYPLPSIYTPSTVFALEAAGISIPVVSYNDKYDYAHFSMAKGKTELTITLLNHAEVSAYYISPRKLKIPALPRGNRLSFTLSKDAYLIVKINGLKELVIAADAAENNPPLSSGKGIFNISAPVYAADASGKTMATHALQQAIDDASAYRNGIVYVPAGVYMVGNIDLKSNISLYLEGGSVLLFSGRAEDYSINARKASQNRNITWWIYTDSGAHDIKLYGRGTLDGNGKYATEKGKIGNHILAIFQTRNFVLDGPVIRNSGAWGIIPTRSSHLVFRNFKLLNRFDMGENDGIDVMESEDVLVQHAIGIALDDPFSTKTWEQNTDLCRHWPGSPKSQKNIVFDDLLSWTYCYAYKVGQGVMQPQTHITFKNCVVYDAAVGIGVHHKWGTAYVDHVLFDNIEIEKLSYQNDDHRTWGVFLMQNGDKKGSGPISNLTVSNIKIYDIGKSPGKIKGLNDARLISNVIFKNILPPGLNRPAATLQEMNMADTVNCRHVRVIL